MNNGINGDPTNENRDYPGLGHYLPTLELYTGTASIPSAAGTATLSHGLKGVPQSVRVMLQCTDAGGDAGYALNDEVEVGSVAVLPGAAYMRAAFAIEVTSTSILVRRATVTPSAETLYAINGTSGAYNAAVDASKWQIKVYATFFAEPTTAS